MEEYFGYFHGLHLTLWLRRKDGFGLVLIQHSLILGEVGHPGGASRTFPLTIPNQPERWYPECKAVIVTQTCPVSWLCSKQTGI